MLFNPVIYIALAALSLALGTVALINTDNMLVMLPSLIFTVLFSVSLFRPVTEKTGQRCLARSRFQRQFMKLTAGRLRAMATADKSGTPAFRT
jgi:uncharacterized membrane protein YbaN (DUF454 family)